jgi:hypothetical protein
VSKDAVMLINKPMTNESTGEIMFTVTQPRIQTDIDPEAEEVYVVNFGEAPLETQYLERVEAYNRE